MGSAHMATTRSPALLGGSGFQCWRPARRPCINMCEFPGADRAIMGRPWPGGLPPARAERFQHLFFALEIILESVLDRAEAARHVTDDVGCFFKILGRHATTP